MTTPNPCTPVDRQHIYNLVNRRRAEIVTRGGPKANFLHGAREMTIYVIRH